MFCIAYTAARDSYGQHLVDLLSRYEQEVDLYKASVRSSKEGKAANEIYYCQLHRQLLEIESHNLFNASALAVGLAERTNRKAQ